VRDYLYVSLGGNRRGQWRTYRNLLLTMLIGGLWHGAAWTFVIWGGLHGLYLAVERCVREHLWPKHFSAPAFLRAGYMLLTLLLVTLAWIFFRAADAVTALHIFALLWPASSGAPLEAAQKLALLAFAGVVAVQWFMRERDIKEIGRRIPAPALGFALGMLLAAIVLSPGDSHAFIYFQF
jgi:D-alanyl-lipoteichoic acid acyltransferase DltB (MBOAT superfamily)